MVRQTKAGKYSSSYFFLSLSGQVVYFHEDYYCTIFSHYLKLLAKVLQNRCLKNFAQLAGKYLYRRLFLISQQPATFSMRDSDLDAFLRILENCQEHHFYRAPWNSCYGTSLQCNSMLISQSGFSNHLRHPSILKCIHVKSKLREREKLFSFFSSDSVIP